MNATGGVQLTPRRTHTRALFLVAHACARQMWLHVWIQGLTICLCVSKSNFATGHVIAECSFDLVSTYFLITYCLTETTYCVSYAIYWNQTKPLCGDETSGHLAESIPNTEPEQLTLITQKQQTLTQARGDSVQLTEKHETMIRKASDQAAFARTVENVQFHITNESAMDGNSSTPSCREGVEPKNSQRTRLQAVLTDDVKIGPATGIEVFKSAGTLVFGVQLPSQQPGYEKSWVRIWRGVEQYARQCIPTQTDRKHLAAVPSQQSLSCGRPRAQETSGNSTVRYKAAPKSKLISIGFSQRVWILMPATALTKRDCEFFVHVSKHLAKSLPHGGCHEADGSCLDEHDKCWANSVLRQRNVDCCTWLFCWQTQNGVLWWSLRERFFTFVQCKDTVMVPESIQLYSFDKDTEHIFHTGRDFQI